MICNESIQATAQKPRFTLGKSEKLRHRTLVEALFAEGESIYAFPLRVKWRIITRRQAEASFRTGLPPRVGHIQMLITVPKKKIRHAVDRVKIRRRIREAYRLNRLPLIHALGGRPDLFLEMAFIFIHNEEVDYASINKKMQRIFSRILSSIESLPSDPVPDQDMQTLPES